MELYRNLQETAKMVQEYIKRYYNKKRSKGPALKEGDKVWLLYKNFKSRQLSKKLDYILIGLTSEDKDLPSTVCYNTKASIREH